MTYKRKQFYTYFFHTMFKELFPDAGSIGEDHLLLFLEKLEKNLPPHTWYGANIKVDDKRYIENDPNFIGVFSEYQSNQLKKIGTIQDLKDKVQYIFQFNAGDAFFIAVKDNIVVKDDITIEYTKTPNLEGTLIEFELDSEEDVFLIYSDDEKILKSITEPFNLELVKSSKDSYF